MSEIDYITSTFIICGKQFILECTSFSLQCNPEKQNSNLRLICSGYGTEISTGKPIYCATAEIDFEQRTDDYQKRTDELQSKLLIVESQKSKLEALLHQNEELIAEFEQRVLLLERGEHAS